MADLTSRIMVVISASGGGAVKELDSLQRQADRTGDAFDTIGKRAGLAGSTIKAGLVAGAAAFVGTGLVSFLNDSVTAFADSQRAAQLFSTAMNTSGENAGKLATYLNTLGIDTNDLIEINAEFGRAVGKNKGVLDDLGVSLKRNRDGTLDTADAFVQVIDGLKGVKDGAARSQLALKFFGEEGTKQLAPLIFGSKDLKATLEDLEFVYDPKRAQEYAAAQQDLDLAFQALQQTIGQALIPAFTDAARATTDVIGFLKGIPTETYLAVGAFAAMKGATSFLGPAFSAGLSEGATALTGLGAAAEAAGGKAGLLKNGFGGLVKAVGPWNLAFIGLAASVTAVSIGADNAQARLEEFAANLDGTKGSLQSSAAAMLETSSAWERFWVTLTNNSEELGAGTWTRILNEALAAAFDAGTEGAEAYEAALRKTKDEMGEAAAAAVDLQVQQRDLNDAVTAFLQNDPSVTWQDVADAARGAAEAQGLVKEATRLAAEQLAIASGDVGYFIEQLSRLENIGGSSVESLKADLEGITFKDVADTWANEATIGAERAYDTILGGLKSALEVNPDLDLSAWLNQFRGLSPELDAIIDQLLADVSTDTKIQAALGITPDPSVAETQAAVDALGNPITGTFDLTSGEGVAAAEAQREEFGKPIDTTLTVDTEFEPGGYNAVKSRVDYLAQARNATLTVNVDFEPGSYQDILARINTIAKNRTATITQVVNQVTGTRVSGGDPEGRTARIPNLYANVQPTNVFKVSIDGQPLRAWIRDEIASAAPARAEVA